MDGPVMAEYQIAVAKGKMALTTMIVNITACAQRQDRDDDYLNIYWKGGRGFEWKPGASEGICYPCDETHMANYLVFWIDRGWLYNYPLNIFRPVNPTARTISISLTVILLKRFIRTSRSRWWQEKSG